MSTFLNDINGHYATEKKAILALCNKGTAFSLADLGKQESGGGVNKLSLNLVNSDTVIKVARLGKSAGAVGASLLIKNQLLQEII